MFDRSILRQNIKDMKKSLSSIEDVFDIKLIEEKIDKLEKASLDASFWLNQAKAKTVIDELNDLKDKASLYRSLKDSLDLLTMLDEEEELDDSYDEEINSAISRFKEDYDTLEKELLLKEKEDKLDCIVEIHSGAGGTESLDWTEMLYRMYTMYAQSHKLKMEALDSEIGEIGIKGITFKLSGRYAYGNLKSETGIHRLVRLSPFDASHSRHTTFASVHVTPLIDDTIDIELKDEDVRIDIFHSSGAGGQGVNTSFSAVRVTHLKTGIMVTCQNERSQIQNKATALKVLKSRLYELELEKRKKEALEKDNKMDISFGSQIRSYVFHPYSMVKDHRTGCETSQVSRVMDGELDEFIKAYLKMEAKSA